jgi:hypothetical protein
VTPKNPARAGKNFITLDKNGATSFARMTTCSPAGHMRVDSFTPSGRIFKDHI